MYTLIVDVTYLCLISCTLTTVPQVVACLLVRGVECRISVRVLCVVLLFEAGNQWLRVDLGLLRLHARHCHHVLLADGQQRLLRVFLVSAADLDLKHGSVRHNLI